MKKERLREAKIIRVCRKIHRTSGILLFVFLFFVTVTGLLLGWKKNSSGLILSKSFVGTSTELRDWVPLDSLHKNACKILHDSISPTLSVDLERIDIRKDKGMVKFVFTDAFWGIQLDGVTGELLHIERRRSDFIEKVHDGSIIDYFFGTTNGVFKLIYTSIIGLGLMVFTATGFWLWYGPRRMRRHKKK